MATYTSVGRTNYFTVRDTAQLEKLLSGSGIEVVHQEGPGERVALLDAEGADWQIYTDDDDYDGIFLPDVISEHLAPGEIAVFQNVGHERMRYVGGQSVAVNAAGEQVVINLGDIYEQAAKAFGVDPRTISTATY